MDLVAASTWIAGRDFSSETEVREACGKVTETSESGSGIADVSDIA